jgi:hypothetical protein
MNFNKGWFSPRRTGLYAHLGTYVKWLLLTPVGILSLFMSVMGMVGVGFGAAPFMLGYLFAFPVFLLNFKYPKAAVIATWCLLLLVYVPLAVYNWPLINPIRLFSLHGHGPSVIICVMTQLAALAPRLDGKFAHR